MINNRADISHVFATRLRGVSFLVALAFAVTGRAQFTRIVDVQFTGSCKALPDEVGIVLHGDEAGQFNVHNKKDGHWVGDLPAKSKDIPASNTIGSARLRGWRTDCQRSSRGTYKGDRVAAFTFKCDPHASTDIEIATNPEKYFSYVRTLLSNPTIENSCDCMEAAASSGQQRIPDLRFSSNSISAKPRRANADPSTPFEELRLQLLATKPPDKPCGLLVNTPEVIAAANKGAIDVHGIVKILSDQRIMTKACQGPTNSPPSIDIDERTFPKFELMLKLKKAE